MNAFLLFICSAIRDALMILVKKLFPGHKWAAATAVVGRQEYFFLKKSKEPIIDCHLQCERETLNPFVPSSSLFVFWKLKIGNGSEHLQRDCSP
jgi:hypothetical protein